MGNPDRPIYQNKRPKGEKPSRLVQNPPEKAPFLVRNLAGLRIDLPGTFGIPQDNRFDIRTRNFGPFGRGASLTPIDKRRSRRT